MTDSASTAVPTPFEKDGVIYLQPYHPRPELTREEKDLIRALSDRQAFVSTELVPKMDEALRNLDQANGKVEGSPSDPSSRATLKSGIGETIKTLSRARQQSLDLGNSLNRLADKVRNESEWSKLQAEAARTQAERDKLEVEAYPVPTWPRFLLSLGLAAVGAASTLLALSQLKELSYIAASTNLYFVGGIMVLFSLGELRKHEGERLARYNQLFFSSPGHPEFPPVIEALGAGLEDGVIPPRLREDLKANGLELVILGNRSTTGEHLPPHKG